MDIKLDTIKTTDDYPQWDISTKDNIAPILADEEADVQCATLACLLEKGTIPQIKNAGVDWAAFLTGNKTFGLIDAEIRESLQKAGMYEFRPDYQIQGDKLTLTVSKEF